MAHRATVRVEKITLPIYRYEEDPFPPLHRRGVSCVYPYSMQNEITDELEHREFEGVILSNGLLEALILPELGGHILSLRDLVRDRELFYKNLPIKFGLIALRGAWYSGGMEFNFPQMGHTVTSNEPLSWYYEEKEDGSATVSIGTVEALTEMAWTVGVRLMPDDLRLHISIFLFNRTNFFHRIYFWTNLAVPAAEDFRFLLPCTTVYSWWWGARGVANFPIHDGKDLSLYTTHPRPTDLFARDLRADWFGCYYERDDTGILHHASRYEVHGRKLWTWGTAEHGQVWSCLLSDSAEPYCEIQTGRFVHQGIHRLMPPRSVQTWKEVWFPFWGLGGVQNASDTVAVKVEKSAGQLRIRLFSVVPIEGARVTVSGPNGRWRSDPIHLRPGQPVSLDGPEVGDGETLCRVEGPTSVLLETKVQVKGDEVRVIYDASPPHTAVREEETDRQTGPSYWLRKAREHEEKNEGDQAAESYRQALTVDPDNAEAMSGLAQWYLKRGETQRAREWAERALRTDPQSPPGLWWLAVSLLMDGQQSASPTRSSAEPYLMALTREPVFSSAAWALLGEEAARRKDWVVALDRFQRAVALNPFDSRSLVFAAYSARQLGQRALAQTFLDRCLKVNPLEPLLWSEKYFIRGEREGEDLSLSIRRVFGGSPYLFLVADADYADLGGHGTSAVWLGSVGERHIRWRTDDHPLVLLRIARSLWEIGKVGEAIGIVRQACENGCSFVFPSGWHDWLALKGAKILLPNHPYLSYLVGTWLASVGRYEEALKEWTQATERSSGGEVPIFALRNIGLIQMVERKDLASALRSYDRCLEMILTVAQARALLTVPDHSKKGPSPFDLMWRIYVERDEVLSRSGDHERRLNAFEMAPERLKGKAQILARWADASVRAGRPDQCVELLSRGTFKPWEGEVHLRELWKESLMQLGDRARENRDWQRAKDYYLRAAEYPANLNIGRLPETDDADAYFWAGWCALQDGRREEAADLLKRAAQEIQPANAASAGFKMQAQKLLDSLSIALKDN